MSSASPPGVSQHRLLAVAVAGVCPSIGRLIAQVLVHLGVEHPLGQRLLQGVKHTVRVERGARVGSVEQLVKQGIRNSRTFAARHDGVLSS